MRAVQTMEDACLAHLEGQRFDCIVLGPVIPSIAAQVEVPGGGQQRLEALYNTQNTPWFHYSLHVKMAKTFFPIPHPYTSLCTKRLLLEGGCSSIFRWGLHKWLRSRAFDAG